MVGLSWASKAQLASLVDFEGKYGNQNPHPESFFEEAIQYQRVLLAHDNDLLAAYLVYEIIWGNTAFLSLLKVSPSHQRQGIGKRMMQDLELRLKEQGFKSYVTSTGATNPYTKHYFSDLGFSSIGSLQMHHGEEVFYLKALG